MSRRRAAEKRVVFADPKYSDQVLTKFMNSLMFAGKKSTAEGIVYGALERIEKRTGQDAIKVFHEALGNVKPGVEVRSRRVGGATYQVPVEVRSDRGQALAIRWLISAARGRSEKTMTEAVVGRAARGRRATRLGRQKARRHPSHGGRQQGVLPLPLVDCSGSAAMPRVTPLQRYRNIGHHGPHRCRQDHDHRAHPLLHRPLPQDGRGARRRRDDGLDGAGAGARHHHHRGGDDLLLARSPYQHHRHAGPR